MTLHRGPGEVFLGDRVIGTTDPSPRFRRHLLDNKEARQAYAKIVRTWSVTKLKQVLRTPQYLNKPDLTRRRNNILYSELVRRRVRKPRGSTLLSPTWGGSHEKS